MNVLNIATLNVNGLRTIEKQNSLKELIVQSKYDILFLQETHFDCKQNEEYFKDNFDCKMFSSFGGNRYCGVSILIFRNFTFSVQKFE